MNLLEELTYIKVKKLPENKISCLYTIKTEQHSLLQLFTQEIFEASPEAASAFRAFSLDSLTRPGHSELEQGLRAALVVVLGLVLPGKLFPAGPAAHLLDQVGKVEAPREGKKA